jgi:hypothetical protein
MITIAVACLALSSSWQAALTLTDFRQIRRMDRQLRVYRVGSGWTDPQALTGRWRAAWVALGTAAGLIPVAVIGDSTVAEIVAILSCGGLIMWVGYNRKLAACIGALAFALLLYFTTRLYTNLPAGQIAGVVASFFAAQLYLVAGIRKLQSRHFMSGRVIVDNLAYGIYQAAAGNCEFIRFTSLSRLADLLGNKPFLYVCRLAAVGATVVELAIGFGALGLLPAAVVFAMAIPSHLAFILISPRRIVPFTVVTLGLVVLAMTHPMLSAVV